MEVLRFSLNKIQEDSLNDFQKEILKILRRQFEQLYSERISDKSYIDDSPFLDVIIHLKESSFTLNFSVRENLFLVNCNYFDIPIYPETPIDLINLLTREILLGHYKVCLYYSHGNALVRKKVFFDKQELKEYNQNQKVSLFNKEIEKEEIINGIQLATSR